MQIKARKCFVAHSPSHWVARVFLTCDNMLAVEFRHGQHVKKVLPYGPGAYLGHGGVPHVCCLYPGTQGELAETLYELAQTWSYGGEWVHHFLYKKFGYQRVSPPAQCGGCSTSCSLAINPADPSVGEAVTITCTVTNTDGSPSKGEAPEGTVTFYLDGIEVGSCKLPEDEPDSKNWAKCSIDVGASCDPTPDHTVQAVYTPAQADWAPTSCGGGFSVSGCNTVRVPCCPNPLPATVHATITDVSGCGCLAGTYALTWDPVLGQRVSLGNLACGFPATSPWNFYLGCLANGTFVFGIGQCNGVSFYGLTTMSCQPLQLVNTDMLVYGCNGDCIHANHAAVTVTL
jgi:hypothetical protein